MRNKYTIKYFIKKFKAIPSKLWVTHTFRHYGGQRCAMGHCGAHFDRRTVESKALDTLFKNRRESVFSVNDGYADFPQKTPRARVLAALRKFSKT